MFAQVCRKNFKEISYLSAIGDDRNFRFRLLLGLAVTVSLSDIMFSAQDLIITSFTMFDNEVKDGKADSSDSASFMDVLTTALECVLQ